MSYYDMNSDPDDGLYSSVSDPYYYTHPYADDELYRYDSNNPFIGGTTENKICDNLIKITNQCIKRKDWIDDSYLLKDGFKMPRLPANPAFVKRLIKCFLLISPFLSWKNIYFICYYHQKEKNHMNVLTSLLRR